MKGTYEQLALQRPQDDLKKRIDQAHAALVAAETWPERAVRWQRLRGLLLRRQRARVGQSAPIRSSGPEHVSTILERLHFEWLLAWETRSTRQ